MGTPQIGISLLALSPIRMGGAGTYTMGLTQALTARAPNRYTLFVPPERVSLWRDRLPAGVNIVRAGPDPDRRMSRVVFEQIVLPKVATRHGVRTMLFPHLFVPRWREPRSVVTIYDLLLLSKITDFPWYKRVYHRWAYRRVSERAARILTISNFCRSEILTRLGAAAEKVVVALPGLDSAFQSDVGIPEATVDLPRFFVLSVAGDYPHKRLSVVLESFAQLSGEMPDLHLVLAGTHAGRGLGPEFGEAVRALGVQRRVVVLPRLEAGDMRTLYDRAAALVSASEFEGFGIPIAEAMAAGCPVAASPASAVLEVLGGCGWVARDFGAEALSTSLRAAIGARERVPADLKRAVDRARSTFTWSGAAEVVEKALSGEGHRGW